MNDRLTRPLSIVPFPVEEFRQTLGTVPSRKLALKFMYWALVRFDHEGGSVPVKLLLLKSRLRTVLKELQVAGMLPAAKVHFNLTLLALGKRSIAVRIESIYAVDP